MKSYEWDLTFLYSSFSCDEFSEDIKKSKLLSGCILNMIGKWDNSSMYLKEILIKTEELLKIFSEVSSYVNLNLLINCNNIEAKKSYEDIAEIQAYINEIKGLLIDKIDLKNIETDELSQYKYFFCDISEIKKHQMSPEIEKIVANLRKCGSYAWQKLRDYIDGNAKGKICINGKNETLSLYEIRNMYYSADEKIRKDAFHSETEIYTQMEEYAAACFNGIKGDAVSLYKLRGFDSVLQNMLFLNKTDDETLRAMNSAISDYLPCFQDYYKAKAKLLNKEKLCYYDLTAPIGKSSKKYSFEEAHNILSNVFKDVDSELYNFVDKAFNDEWFDVAPRDGKVGGALCADLPTKNCSRIFLNYSGSFSNLRTCAHELGHAYHGQCLSDVPLLIRDAPTPICETASIFNETLFQQKILENENENEDKLILLDASISESAQTVVDIYSRFLFEDEVFKIRENRSLSVEEIKNLMCEAQIKAYGDSIDENYLHPYMWICKPHYYITDYHYYNFPYIFGLLFAKGLYAKYEEDKKSFFPKYKTFLSNTCNGNIKDVAGTVGIDVHDKKFWMKSLEIIKKDIDLFIKSAEMK